MAHDQHKLYTCDAHTVLQATQGFASDDIPSDAHAEDIADSQIENLMTGGDDNAKTLSEIAYYEVIAEWELFLEDYEIEPPSLLLIKVDEIQRLEIKATLQPTESD